MSEKELTFEEEFTLPVQKKILALLIFDQDWAAINGLDIILPEYFENQHLKRVCKFIHEYFRKYKQIPSQKALFEMSRDYVNDTALPQSEYYACENIIKEIFEMHDIKDFEFFKDKAVKFARQVTWKKALEKGGSVLKHGNYSEAIELFKKVLNIDGDNDLGLDFYDTSTEAFVESLSEAYDKENMLKTGISKWDEALGGGFVRKNLHIIAAPPGGGKSRIMAFLAREAMKQNKRIIFITLELDQTETMANINTAVTGLGIGQMLSMQSRQEFEEKIQMFKNTFNPDLTIKFFKPASVNADTIYNYIQKLSRIKEEKFNIKWKPDVIFLDYMDKLLPTQKVRGNSYEDMGGVANDCKNLAISFDCPVITGSQLGKYSWNVKGSEVVSMDSIAESAQKVHLAHSMTTINSNPSEKAAHRARLFMAKSRSGSVGTVIWSEINLAKCYIEEKDPWDPLNVGLTVDYEVRSAIK